VNRLDSAAPQLEIVRAIVALAQNLGMDVIAEGVETLPQANALCALNCTQMQGFLFSHPLPAAEAEQTIIHGLGSRVC